MSTEFYRCEHNSSKNPIKNVADSTNLWRILFPIWRKCVANMSDLKEIIWIIFVMIELLNHLLFVRWSLLLHISRQFQIECSQEHCSHFDQNSDLKAADFGILKYQEVFGKSAKGRKMAEENNGNNLCESSDSIMTILDQMADSVQLDYTGGHIVLWSLEWYKQSYYK